MFAGVGDHVGALLSLVTSGVPFEDAAMGLTVLYEESLPSAATTLKNLLEVSEEAILYIAFAEMFSLAANISERQ